MNGSLRRRKVIAFVLSGIFPGLGQLYNRQPVKGAALLVAGVVLTWLWGRAIPGDLLEQLTPGADLRLLLGLLLNVWSFLLLIVWLWSLIDAWRAPDRAGPGIGAPWGRDSDGRMDR